MKKRITSIMNTGNRRVGLVVICAVLLLTMGTGAAFAIRENMNDNRDDSGAGVLISANRNDEKNYSEEEWAAILQEVENGNILFFETKADEDTYFQSVSMLQKATGDSSRQAQVIAKHLAESNITYSSISISNNPIVDGIHIGWKAYDLFTDDGTSYVLILRKSDNDFTSVLDSDGLVISGMVDNVVTPALYVDGKYIFEEQMFSNANKGSKQTDLISAIGFG